MPGASGPGLGRAGAVRQLRRDVVAQLHDQLIDVVFFLALAGQTQDKNDAENDDGDDDLLERQGDIPSPEDAESVQDERQEDGDEEDRRPEASPPDAQGLEHKRREAQENQQVEVAGAGKERRQDESGDEEDHRGNRQRRRPSGFQKKEQQGDGRGQADQVIDEVLGLALAEVDEDITDRGEGGRDQPDQKKHPVGFLVDPGDGMVPAGFPEPESLRKGITKLFR